MSSLPDRGRYPPSVVAMARKQTGRELKEGCLRGDCLGLELRPKELWPPHDLWRQTQTLTSNSLTECQPVRPTDTGLRLLQECWRTIASTTSWIPASATPPPLSHPTQPPSLLSPAQRGASHTSLQSLNVCSYPYSLTAVLTTATMAPRHHRGSTKLLAHRPETILACIQRQRSNRTPTLPPSAVRELLNRSKGLYTSLAITKELSYYM